MYYCYYDDFKNHIFINGKTVNEAKRKMLHYLNSITNGYGPREYARCSEFKDQYSDVVKWIRKTTKRHPVIHFSIIDHKGKWHQFGKIEDPLILTDRWSKPFQVIHKDDDKIVFCNRHRYAFCKIVLEVKNI